MNDKIPVYGQKRAGVYLLSEIYNPDNVSSTVQNIGKVIPAIGSLVVDDSIAEHNELYVVYSVNPKTYKTTLVPAALASNSDDNYILTYGNNIYCLFYKQDEDSIYIPTPDTRFIASKTYYVFDTTLRKYVVAVTPAGGTIPANTYYERLTTYAAVIDNKIIVFGTEVSKYSIFEGTEVTDTSKCISNYYIENGKVIESNEIPMDDALVPTTDIYDNPAEVIGRVPRKCYSNIALSENRKYSFVAFTDDGKIIANIVLTGKSMLGIHELISSKKPIISMTITSNQIDPTDNKHILYRHQNPQDLNFFININYADGTSRESIAIDGNRTFEYGRNDIRSTDPGSEYPMTFKYYLGNREKIDISAAHDYSIGAINRYIYTTATVKIVAPIDVSVAKIAPIIRYDGTKYTILPVVFYKNRVVPGISGDTDRISGFNGTAYDQIQTVSLKTSITNASYTFKYDITLFNPAEVLAKTKDVYYYYRDNPSATGIHYGRPPRPCLNYNVATTKYTFDTTVFSSVTAFLTSFYYDSCPPVLEEEGSIAKTPTHFTIYKLHFKDASVAGDEDAIIPVLTAPVKVSEYANSLPVTTPIYRTGSQIAETCMIEFLFKDDTMSADFYEHLYGAPIDINIVGGTSSI